MLFCFFYKMVENHTYAESSAAFFFMTHYLKRTLPHFSQPENGYCKRGRGSAGLLFRVLIERKCISHIFRSSSILPLIFSIGHLIILSGIYFQLLKTGKAIYLSICAIIQFSWPLNQQLCNTKFIAKWEMQGREGGDWKWTSRPQTINLISNLLICMGLTAIKSRQESSLGIIIMQEISSFEKLLKTWNCPCLKEKSSSVIMMA